MRKIIDTIGNTISFKNLSNHLSAETPIGPQAPFFSPEKLYLQSAIPLTIRFFNLPTSKQSTIFVS